MAEMLIDGAKLDACLDAEADAIRAKTGGIDPIPYDYANNKGFADAIAEIESGSKKAEGVFTLSSVGNPPTILHNLGTKKIFVIVQPISVRADTGYRHFYFTWANIGELYAGESWELDFTSYNSAKFPDPVEVDVSEDTHLRYGTIHQSPWTTQSNWWQGIDTIATNKQTCTVTDDTLTVNLNIATGSYKYTIWSLE